MTIAVQMKDGEQINAFGASVKRKLVALRQYFPKTSSLRELRISHYR